MKIEEKVVGTTQIVEVETLVETPVVILTLDEDEAVALMAVFGSICGWSENGHNVRKVTDKIYDELVRLGYDKRFEDALRSYTKTLGTTYTFFS